MKKFILLVLFIVFAYFPSISQDLQATLKHGATPDEIYFTIRNNTSSNITGNVTKITFTLVMHLNVGAPNAFWFRSWSLLPKPGTGSYASHDFTSMTQNYLATTWTGSKSIDLGPGEELHLIAFELGGKYNNTWIDPLYPGLGLRHDQPMASSSTTKWPFSIEVDGVDRTVGTNRFYSNDPLDYLSNLDMGSGFRLNSFSFLNLPVTLSEFGAQNEGETVSLQWATTDEANSSYFQIENSLDAKKWKVIGTIMASGESSALLRYSFNHDHPQTGINYYRLKMVDIDRTFAFSKIVNVNVTGGQSKSLYPNPVADRVFFNASDLKNTTRVQVLNTSGRVVQEAVSVDASGMDVRHLPSGLFIVKILKTDGATSNYKMMKN
jgi:hypothetical protein